MCTCQLIYQEQRGCVCRCRYQQAGPSLSSVGTSTGWSGWGGGGGVRPLPSPPPNPLFYFKNAYNPAMGLDVAWGCTIEEPGLCSPPCHCNEQAVGSRVGVRSAVSRISRSSPRPCISTGQRDLAPRKCPLSGFS